MKKKVGRKPVCRCPNCPMQGCLGRTLAPGYKPTPEARVVEATTPERTAGEASVLSADEMDRYNKGMRRQRQGRPS